MMKQPASITISLDGTGAGTGYFQNNYAGKLWIVRQISMGPSSPSQAGVTAVVKYNVQLIDTNYFVGTGGSLAGDPPVEMRESDIITISVTNGPANGSLPVSFYYEEIP